MRIVRKYVGFIFFIFPLFAISQDANEELLNWNTGKKLVWEDYKSRPDSKSDAAASTATYLGINYSVSGNSVSYKISCSFSKDRSWGRYKTEYILSHEQGHFDITEIFARKLNKRISEYKFDSVKYKTDLQKIYQDILDEKEQFQNQYDDETDFSRNKDKQAEWLIKISKMLNDLKAYGNYIS
jgi:hypothetical protein